MRICTSAACALLALALAAFICSTAWRGASNTSPGAGRSYSGIRIAFTRIGPIRTGLFIATPTDGTKSPSCPQRSLDYNASFSTDGRGSFSHRSVLVRRIFTGFTRMAVGWSG